MPAPEPGRLVRQARRLFTAMFLGTALAAYTLGPVPIPWLAQAGCIALAAAMVLRTGRIEPGPGQLVLAGFLWLAVVLTAVHGVEFGHAMPPGATLPYGAFLLVRFINLLSFCAAFYVVQWLLRHGAERELYRALVGCGVVVALFGIYVLAAEVFGLPQPPRTRLGTGGGAQVTGMFTGIGTSYFRALGSFREPSHLAEWLLGPLFVALLLRARAATVVMALALVLTVSLTGLLSAAAGVVGMIVLGNPFRRHVLAYGARLALLAAVVVLAGMTVQVAAGDTQLTALGIVGARLGAIAEGGVLASNRGAIYEFVMQHPPLAPFGVGLGNANLLLSQGEPLVTSFLSLYLNTSYALGVVGLAVLLLFLLAPLVAWVRHAGSALLAQRGYLLAGYLAYLLAFAVHSEELTIPFAVIAASTAFFAGQAGRSHQPAGALPS